MKVTLQNISNLDLLNKEEKTGDIEKHRQIMCIVGVLERFPLFIEIKSDFKSNLSHYDI